MTWHVRKDHLIQGEMLLAQEVAEEVEGAFSQIGELRMHYKAYIAGFLAAQRVDVRTVDVTL